MVCPSSLSFMIEQELVPVLIGIKERLMKKAVLALMLAGSLGVGSVSYFAMAHESRCVDLDHRVQHTFSHQNIDITEAQARQIRDNVNLALEEIRRSPRGNSKIQFTAVEIATDLGLNPQMDKSVVSRIVTALKAVSDSRAIASCPGPEREDLSWNAYYDKTLSLTNNTDFLSLLADRKFHPVKISWEDIGRYQNSVWGDRISDVGIWVRKNESDPESAQLALSVRRDSNYRDKILMVPAEKIKVHVKQGSRTLEMSLPERLKQLGLASPKRDRNVIVSNQFAVVPVPAKTMGTARQENHPPRAAFNFSIYPYGSTNFVITDVIEGSSNAIVGPGNHQLLYANVNGQKAPFTASRAEDRQDLLKLEAALKAKGMDVDVQRYYLIQIPLKKDAQGVELSNMGTPPSFRHTFMDFTGEMPKEEAMPTAPAMGAGSVMMKSANAKRQQAPGLSKVAIGHGETEGAYREGSGYWGNRADEPIRVTVVYFVTPVGEVTERDMQTFTHAFESWDQQAIWGGSFVTGEET